MPIIFPFALSPKVTCPPSLASSLLNYSLSPVMCLEHPLSRYHLLFVLVDFKRTYKTQFIHSFEPKPFLAQVGQSQDNPRGACLSAISNRSIHCQCDLQSCNKSTIHQQIYLSQDGMLSQCMKHALCFVVQDIFYISFKSYNVSCNYNDNVQYFQVQCVVQHAYDCCAQCTYKHVQVVLF